jgi:hypothetical protein
LELAEWLVSPGHTLTARVMVNRIWHWHFGQGLVDSPSNFGLRGGTPSHPALLDYLAQRFVEDGWSVKAFHKRVMLSSTYQMRYVENADYDVIDPENRLLWRANRKRLEAEPIRDALFAMGGNLDLTVGGTIVENIGPIDEDVGQRYVRDGLPQFYGTTRRALYMPIIRNRIYPLFKSFDYSDPSVPIPKRPVTVVAPQSLMLLNSPLVLDSAEKFAQRMLDAPAADDAERIQLAYLEAYSRPATEKEIVRAEDFLVAMRAKAGTPGGKIAAEVEEGEEEVVDADLFAWKNFCHVILASSEFIYIS